MLKKVMFFIFFISINLFSKIVIFDYGGVLYKFNMSEINKFIIDTFNLTDKEAKDITKQLLFKTKYEGKDEEFCISLAKERNIELKDDWFVKYREMVPKTIKKIPFVEEIAKDIKKKGHTVGMLSNIQTKHSLIIRKLGHYDIFDPLFLSCEIGIDKPDEKAFIFLLERLGCRADECVFVDDDIENVVVSKKLGIDVIHFKSSNQLFHELKARGFDISESCFDK